MTMRDVMRILNGWKRNPPAHHMIQTIARMLGWENPHGDNGDDYADPEVSFPPEMSIITPDPRMPAVSFDLDELRRRNEEAVARIAVRNEERRLSAG